MILARQKVLEVVVLLQSLLRQQIVVLHHRHLVILRRARHPVHLHRVLEVSLPLTPRPRRYIRHEFARQTDDLAGFVALNRRHLRVAPSHEREFLALLERFRVGALQHHVRTDRDLADALRFVLRVIGDLDESVALHVGEMNNHIVVLHNAHVAERVALQNLFIVRPELVPLHRHYALREALHQSIPVSRALPGSE